MPIGSFRELGKTNSRLDLIDQLQHRGPEQSRQDGGPLCPLLTTRTLGAPGPWAPAHYHQLWPRPQGQPSLSHQLEQLTYCRQQLRRPGGGRPHTAPQVGFGVLVNVGGGGGRPERRRGRRRRRRRRRRGRASSPSIEACRALQGPCKALRT